LIALKTVSKFVYLHVPTHSHSKEFNSETLSKEEMKKAEFSSIAQLMIGEVAISVHQFLPFSIL